MTWRRSGFERLKYGPCHLVRCEVLKEDFRCEWGSSSICGASPPFCGTFEVGSSDLGVDRCFASFQFRAGREPKLRLSYDDQATLRRGGRVNPTRPQPLGQR